MRNIWRIFRSDWQRISASVVAVVVIMGLCLIPCLYAWFNIFSNWDPYGPDSTSNIRVAVTSEDEGYELLGLKLNIGSMVLDGLKSNHQMGWDFVDSREEALEGVRSGKYYAALIVPSDFTGDFVSILDTDLRHPQIQYYENQKKNAIAPKITNKAKTAVQDEIKQAEAQKKAAIGRNEAQKEIALSNSELAVTQANADKQAGEAAAKSEAAVQTAKEIAQKEVEEAKARKVESSLKAEKIVPAEVARQEAILQAEAVAEKITREAEARAKATLAQAEAEAKAIQLKLEAEAEGKKRSLLAEAEGFEAMVKAAESNPAIAIQYKMVDQWKEIAGEQVKAFEHMNLGNITVFDGGNGGTSNFLNTLVKTVAPSLGVLDKLPIGETVKNIIHPEEKDKKEEKEDKKQ